MKLVLVSSISSVVPSLSGSQPRLHNSITFGAFFKKQKHKRKMPGSHLRDIYLIVMGRIQASMVLKAAQEF